jgi:hypothetical protein
MLESEVSTSGGTFLVELHVLIEQRDRRAHEHLLLALVDLEGLVHRLDVGRKRAFRGQETVDTGPLIAFDQDLHGPVGELKQLQDVGQGSDLVEILHARVVDIGALLGDQEDLFVARHRGIERANRFVSADKERNHHMRINNDVPQWEDRDFLKGTGCRAGY